MLTKQKIPFESPPPTTTTQKKKKATENVGSAEEKTLNPRAY